MTAGGLELSAEELASFRSRDAWRGGPCLVFHLRVDPDDADPIGHALDTWELTCAIDGLDHRSLGEHERLWVVGGEWFPQKLGLRSYRKELDRNGCLRLTSHPRTYRPYVFDGDERWRRGWHERFLDFSVTLARRVGAASVCFADETWSAPRDMTRSGLYTISKYLPDRDADEWLVGFRWAHRDF